MKKGTRLSSKAYFHYERRIEYSLFVLLIFLLRLAFALILSAKRLIKKQRMLHSTLVVETSLNAKKESMVEVLRNNKKKTSGVLAQKNTYFF